MRLEHLAIWVRDIETIREFYETCFGAKSNDKHSNDSKKFESYFLSFQSGARLELMHRPDIDSAKDAEHRYVAVNRQNLTEVFGLTDKDELIGRTDADFQPPRWPRRTIPKTAA